MTPFFDADNLPDLRSEAASWHGTPFCQRGAVKRGGVSCALLCAAIYKATGFMPQNFFIPNGRADWARHRKVSQMEPWLDACQLFAPCEVDDVQPGDLLGMQGPSDGCINHLGIALDAGQWVHCLAPTGVRVDNMSDPTFIAALRRVWRPLKA